MKKKALLLPLLFVGCVSNEKATTPEVATRNVSSVTGEIDYTKQFPPTALGVYPHFPIRSDLGEVLQPQEKEDVEKSIGAVEQEMMKRYRESKDIGRGDHSTSHGCYAAIVQVGDALKNPLLERGFARPEYEGRVFQAVVRLSNGEVPHTPDLRAASMGLALKVYLDSASPRGYDLKDSDFLLGSENPGLREQDFLTGVNPTFLAKDIKDYSDIFAKRVDPSFRDFVSIGTKHTKSLIVDRFIVPQSRGVNDAPLFLGKRFWSVHPFAWGDRAAKYSFVPCHKRALVKPGDNAKRTRYQQTLIEEHLNEADMCYRLVVQQRPSEKDPKFGGAEIVKKHFPLEDAKVFWPEKQDKDSIELINGKKVSVHVPYVPVATLKITRGTPALPPEQCEKLVFNPWNAFKEHQPLGNLARARLSVYKKSKEVRYRMYHSQEVKK